MILLWNEHTFSSFFFSCFEKQICSPCQWVWRWRSANKVEITLPRQSSLLTNCAFFNSNSWLVSRSLCLKVFEVYALKSKQYFWFPYICLLWIKRLTRMRIYVSPNAKLIFCISYIVCLFWPMVSVDICTTLRLWVQVFFRNSSAFLLFQVFRKFIYIFSDSKSQLNLKT